MADIAKIKTSFERNAKAMGLRPSVAQGTAKTTVRMVDGLSCEVEDGDWKFKVDMPEKSGGANTGPNPGVYARAALGSCLAVSYILYAVKRDVPLDSLEVEVQSDNDSRGYHGVGDAKPGCIEMRYIVTVGSPAPEADVMAMLDDADLHCDNLYIFRDAQKITREVRLNPQGSDA